MKLLMRGKALTVGDLWTIAEEIMNDHGKDTEISSTYINSFLSIEVYENEAGEKWIEVNESCAD